MGIDYRDQVIELSFVLDDLCKGIHALEFMGKHSHGVVNGQLCAQCARASMESYIGLISVEEATHNLCDELKQAVADYKAALKLVEKWEKTDKTKESA